MSGAGPLFTGFNWRRPVSPFQSVAFDPLPPMQFPQYRFPSSQPNFDAVNQRVLDSQRLADVGAIQAVEQQAQAEAVQGVESQESWFEYVINSAQKPLDAVKNAVEAVANVIATPIAMGIMSSSDNSTLAEGAGTAAEIGLRRAGKAGIRAIGSAMPFSEGVAGTLLPKAWEQPVADWLGEGAGTAIGGNQLFGSTFRPRDVGAGFGAMAGQELTNTDAAGGLFSEFGQSTLQDVGTLVGLAGEIVGDPLNYLLPGAGVARQGLNKGGVLAGNLSRGAGIRVAREMPEVGMALKAAGFAEEMAANPTAVRTAFAKAGRAADEIDVLADGVAQAVKGAELDIMARPVEQQAKLFNELFGADNLVAKSANEALAASRETGATSLIPGTTFGEQALLGQRDASGGGLLSLANKPTVELGGKLAKKLSPELATRTNEQAFFAGLTKLNESLGAGSNVFKPVYNTLARMRAGEISQEEAAAALKGLGPLQGTLAGEAAKGTFTNQFGRWWERAKDAIRGGFIQDADTAATQALSLVTPTFREQIGAVFDKDLAPILKAVDDSVAKARANGAYDDKMFMARVRRAVESKAPDEALDDFTDLVNETARSVGQAEEMLFFLQNSNRAVLRQLDDGMDYFGRVFSPEMQELLGRNPQLRDRVRAWKGQSGADSAALAREAKGKFFEESEKGLRDLLGIENPDFKVFVGDVGDSLRVQAERAQERILRGRLLDELVQLSQLPDADPKLIEGVAAGLRGEIDTAVGRGKQLAPAIKGAADKRVVVSREVADGLKRAGLDEAGAVPVVQQWESLSPNTRSHLKRMVEKPGKAKSGGMAKLAKDLTKARDSVRKAVDTPPRDAVETAFEPAARGGKAENIGPALKALERLGGALADRGITQIDGENVADAIEAILTRGRTNQLAPGELGNALDMGIRAAQNIAETRAVGKEVAGRLEKEALDELAALGITVEDGAALATKIDALGNDAVNALRPAKVKDADVEVTRRLTPEEAAAEVKKIREGDSRSKWGGRATKQADEPVEMVEAKIPLSWIDSKTIQMLKETTDPARVSTYAKQKISTPIVVKMSGSGSTARPRSPYVTDGGHRTIAAVERGDESINVLISPAELDELSKLRSKPPTTGTGDSVFKEAVEQTKALTKQREEAYDLLSKGREKVAKGVKDEAPATARDLTNAQRKLDEIDGKLADMVEKLMPYGTDTDDVLRRVPNEAKAAWVKRRVEATGFKTRPGMTTGLDMMRDLGTNAMLPTDLGALTRLAMTEVPDDVVRSFRRLSQITSGESQAFKFIRDSADAVNSVWRGFILSTPVSIVNDLVGNMLTAVTLGNLSFGEVKDGMRAYLSVAQTDGKFAGIFKKTLGGGGDEIIDTAFGKMTRRDAVRELEKRGFYDVRNAVTVRDPASELAKSLPTTKQGALARGARKAIKGAKAVGREGFALREINDNGFKTAVALAELQKGKSWEDAMRAARNVFFDYSDVTRMEKEWLRRLTLFYTWTRKAIPTALRSIVENPVRFKMMMLVSGAGQNTNDPDMPEWARRLPGLYLGENEDGVPEMLAMPGAMLNSTTEMLEGDVVENLVRMSNPLIRTGIEIATDRDLFTGDPIGFKQENQRAALIEGKGADRAPSWMNLLPKAIKDEIGFRAVTDNGVVVKYAIDPRLRFVLENALPLGAAMRTADLAAAPFGADERKGMGEQLLPLTGARIRSIPSAAPDAAMKRKLGQLRDRIGVEIAAMPDSPIFVSANYTWRPNRSSKSGEELAKMLDAIEEPARRLVSEELDNRGLRGAARSLERDRLLSEMRMNILESRYPGVAAKLRLLEKADMAHAKLTEPEKWEQRYKVRLRDDAKNFGTEEQQSLILGAMGITGQ